MQPLEHMALLEVIRTLSELVRYKMGLKERLFHFLEQLEM